MTVWKRVGAGLAAVAVLGFLLTGGATQVIELARRVGDAAGPLGPIAFALLYALGAVLLVPGAPMTALAGVLFGPALGSATVVVGATVGATAAFLLGRGLARQRVRALLGDRLGRADRWLTNRGFTAILLLRLVPAVPFSALNYAAGVSGVRLRHYVPATALGIIPGTIAYAALGGTIANPTSPEFLAAVAFFVTVIVATAALRRRIPWFRTVDEPGVEAPDVPPEPAAPQR
jgi:uncharacterized membrane protein YdjX (TVP38/TMEM64 family)